MGAWFTLVNFTRRETLDTTLIGGCKAREMTQNHPSSALIVWYLLRHRGDQIAFVSDYDIDAGRVVFGHRLTYELIKAFADVTEETIAHAVAARVITDNGSRPIDDADPDLGMMRLLQVDGWGEGLIPSDDL